MDCQHTATHVAYETVNGRTVEVVVCSHCGTKVG